MTNSSETYVTRDKQCKHWFACRDALTISGDAQLWRTAFDEYFRARLVDRYLNPIKTLQDHGHWQGEGFSIAAIQCSLVEFLESTVQGKNYRYVRKGDPPLTSVEYSKSGEIFTNFLRERVPFKAIFGSDPALAEDFYASVRCGLLHEACTKNGWLIHAGTSPAAMVDASQRILYRDKFQEALLQFVAWYEQALPCDSTLQEAFVRKFNALCPT